MMKRRKSAKLSPRECEDLEALMFERIGTAVNDVTQLFGNPKQRTGFVVHITSAVFKAGVISLMGAYKEDTGKDCPRKHAITILAAQCMADAR
jgi:hypothetical protein